MFHLNCSLLLFLLSLLPHPQQVWGDSPLISGPLQHHLLLTVLVAGGRQHRHIRIRKEVGFTSASTLFLKLRIGQPTQASPRENGINMKVNSSSALHFLMLFE